MFGSSKHDRFFYAAFENHAAATVAAARLLVTMFERIGEAPEIAKQIADLEHQGDKITHEAVADLHKNWITPMDHGDVMKLISVLDDVLDFVEAVSERVVLYEIDEVPEHALQLSQVLVCACEAVEKAIKLLSNRDRAPEIIAICVEVNRLENRADDLYSRALAGMYRERKPGAVSSIPPPVVHVAGQALPAQPRRSRSIPADHGPLDVLKWRDIYDGLEAATDRCEDVANIIEGVVLEYA
jgi:predicted phosphate transport protein (TIGR00153 family)